MKATLLDELKVGEIAVHQVRVLGSPAVEMLDATTWLIRGIHWAAPDELINLRKLAYDIRFNRPSAEPTQPANFWAAVVHACDLLIAAIEDAEREGV